MAISTNELKHTHKDMAWHKCKHIKRKTYSSYAIFTSIKHKHRKNERFFTLTVLFSLVRTTKEELFFALTIFSSLFPSSPVFYFMKIQLPVKSSLCYQRSPSANEWGLWNPKFTSS